MKKIALTPSGTGKLEEIWTWDYSGQLADGELLDLLRKQSQNICTLAVIKVLKLF